MQEQHSRLKNPKRQAWSDYSGRDVVVLSVKTAEGFGGQKVMWSNLCCIKLLWLVNGELLEMVKKSNEENRREATASVQSKYNDGSKLKKMERFKIYLVHKVNRRCCRNAYKVVEKEDQE